MYYIDGYYYAVIITWPSGQGRQVVHVPLQATARALHARPGLNTYEARGVLNSNGFAQGSLVPISRANGTTDWYGHVLPRHVPDRAHPGADPGDVAGRLADVRQQRRGAGGRRPSTSRSSSTPAQETFERQQSLVASDDFANDAPHRPYMDEQWTIPATGDGSATAPGEIAPNGSRLDTVWQWNHAPDNRFWSLTARDGWLRLTTSKVVTGQYVFSKLSNRPAMAWLEEARNTLSQRTFGPRQSVETTLDVSGDEGR